MDFPGKNYNIPSHQAILARIVHASRLQGREACNKLQSIMFFMCTSHGNPADKFEEAGVFNLVRAIGHNRLVFAIRNVFVFSNVVEEVHVCSVHIQAIFLVERMLYYGKIYYLVLAA